MIILDDLDVILPLMMSLIQLKCPLGSVYSDDDSKKRLLLMWTDGELLGISKTMMWEIF